MKEDVTSLLTLCNLSLAGWVSQPAALVNKVSLTGLLRLKILQRPTRHPPTHTHTRFIQRLAAKIYSFHAIKPQL